MQIVVWHFLSQHIVGTGLLDGPQRADYEFAEIKCKNVAYCCRTVEDDGPYAGV